MALNHFTLLLRRRKKTRERRFDKEESCEDDVTTSENNGLCIGGDEDEKEDKSKPCNNHYQSDSSESMEGTREKSKIRMSVEDIRRIFESRSADQSPVRSSTTKLSATLKKSGGIGENISRFEQASLKNTGPLQKPKKFFGSFRRRSQEKVSAKTTQEASRSKQLKGGKEMKGAVSFSTDHIPKENEFENTTTSTPKVSHSNTENSAKKTFLFSPQAYSSLQRSSDLHTTARIGKSNRNEFRMDIDAMMKNNGGLRKRSNTMDEITTTRNECSRSFEDVTRNTIIVPPRRSLMSSHDSDAYADVWDAKVKECDMKSTDSIYADVWDSRNSPRRSICENDDDDYSEVYDATTDAAGLRNPEMHCNNGIRVRPVSQGFASTRPRSTSQSSNPDPRARKPHAGPLSPLRPPLPVRRNPRPCDSSTGSDGSGQQEPFVNDLPPPTEEPFKNSCDWRGDPLYCVI